MYLVNIPEVFALDKNATAGVTSNGVQDCDIKYTGVDANGNNVNNKCHSNYDIEVTYNGQKLEGFCGDLNKHLSGAYAGSGYYCEEIADSALSYILGSGYSRSEKTAALRAYESGISVDNVYVNQLLSEAGIASGGTLSLTKISESGNVMTFRVVTAANDVSFTCGENCSGISYSGGMLTVTAAVGSCNVSFTATYSGGTSGNVPAPSGGRVLQCTSLIDDQKIYTYINDGTSNGGSNNSSISSGNANGKTSQSFSYSFDPNGSYYKEYCDGTEPNTCVCNQKTTVNMPGLCDSGMNSASITAPTDVKCCILNNKDEAGNTYQMLDNQVSLDNPYCAVYCKEDYEMTLPGAKYTTSGRYFELENSIVSAKRTCYATNPNKNSNEPQILIDEFVEDVKNQQNALISAFNAYQLAKAEWESVSELEEENTKTTCPRYNGIGVVVGSYEMEYMKPKEGPNKEQKIANSSMKNSLEGSYNATTSAGETSASIGENCSCNEGCDPAGRYKTKAEYLDAYNRAAEVFNEARETLKKTIEHMEECYSWINDLCMDPVVEFDYDEQYNSSINYTKVSGGGSFPSSNATYSDQKTIDNEYTANSGGSLEDVKYAYCDTDECSNDFSEGYAEQISTMVTHLYYRKIEANGSAEYANTQQFQTNYPHGTIDTVSDPSALRPNYSYLGAVFPVALNTPTGVYSWTLHFTNLGKYNDYVGCGLGRLDTVVAALGESTAAGLEYVCVYVVDCDDCDYDCVGEGCLITDNPKCPECDVYCTNCIFDGDGNTFYFEVETLNDSNPTNRTRGINWSESNDKAKATLNEIESMGESVYINEQFKFIMTSENMAALRKYNAETGNYVSEDLEYHTIGDVTNAYGTSKVLDIGDSKGYFTTITRTTTRTLWTGTISEGMGPVWKVEIGRAHV